MRMVFLQDVPGVASGGDVRDVRNGFARNYLIPQKLATPATPNALQQIERLKRQAEQVRIKALTDIRAVASHLDGAQVNVEVRAGMGGRLYGSVTPAMIAKELSVLVGSEVDRRAIDLNEPIRQVGVFNVRLALHAEVDATVRVVVYGSGTDPAALLKAEAPGVEEEALAVAVEEGVPAPADAAEGPVEPPPS